MPLSSSSAFSQDGRRMGRLALGVLLLLAGAAQALSLAWPWARGQGDGPLSLVGGYGRPLWWLQILSLAVLARALQTAQRPAQAAGGPCLCHRLAGGHLLVAVHLHACLWRTACAAGRCRRAGACGLPGQLLRGGRLGLAQAAPHQHGGRRLAFRRRLAAGRIGAWLAVDRLSLGRGGYAHVEGPLSVLPRWIGVYGTGAVASWLAYWLAALAAGSRADKPFGLHGARPLWRPWFWPGAGCGGFAMPPSMHHRPNGQR